MKYIVQERIPNPDTYYEFEESDHLRALIFITKMMMSQEKYKHLEIKSIDFHSDKKGAIYTLGEKGKTC